MSSKELASRAVALLVGTIAAWRWPFPEDQVVLQLVHLERPALFYALKCIYATMLFSTPYIASLVLWSMAYIFLASPATAAVVPRLPAYPPPASRESIFVVLGEVHHAKRPDPIEAPRWLAIPERGLYTGLSVFGAIGSGKTSACMYPFAEQLLAYRSRDRREQIGGLVLEVKGDVCHKVREILDKHGRSDDYVEVSLASDLRYNPLHNDLDAYTLAYGIASLLNNLFGKGREPFWQQAYTNLVKFVILLHRLTDAYVTLFDVYQGAISPDYLERKIKEGETRSSAGLVAISFDAFMSLQALEDFPFEREDGADRMISPANPELIDLLNGHGIAYDRLPDPEAPAAADPPWTDEQRQQFEAVRRWFYQDWLRIDLRLRTSIVEGIAVFLSMFDDNPAVKRIFCPPKAVYDPVKNADGHLGRPLAPFAELVEEGKVCALNFPVSANPGLARTIGTLMKLDFQRALLNRIPQMEQAPERLWRPALFLCDEYHAFATVGENDPSGDEKFFALSRQAKCIPVVATHSLSSLRSTLPGESWRTLLQTFRTKIFLTLSDDFSARTASDLCGKEEQLKASYTISEQGQDAGVSLFTGRAAAHRSAIGATKSYNVQRDFVFEPKVFSELSNAQAIVLAYDGVNPQPPTYCYLKPYFLDPNVSYFAHRAQGRA
jgi:hypothetical protein